MPALLFPSDDVLRLALSAGVIPPAAATGPVRGGIDGDGRVWADVPTDLHKGVADAVVRLGAVPYQPADVPRPFYCWHQLVGLRPDATLFGPVQIELADSAAKRTTLGVAAELRFLPGRTCLVSPPFAGQDDAPAYAEQVPGVWVRTGWSHPLADAIRPPAGTFYLLDPGREWRVVSSHAFRPHAAVRVAGGFPPSRVIPLPALVVRLGLRPSSTPDTEPLWVIDDPAAWQDFLRAADGRALRAIRVALLADGRGGWRAVVRPAPGRHEAGLPVVPGTAFVAQSVVFAPAGQQLATPVRRDRLAAAVGLPAGGLAWVEPAGVHRTAAAFRPAAGFVEYVARPLIRLTSCWEADPFAFDPVGTVHEPELPSEMPLPPRAADGWLARSLGRLTKRARPSRPAIPPPAPAVQRSPDSVRSPDAVPNWSARRADLEDRLVHTLHRLPAAERAALWADAAAAATAGGAFSDAGLCWTNAVWESSAPPAVWFDDWLRTESRLARVDVPPVSLGECLALTPCRVSPRLVAAYLAWCGSRPAPPADSPLRLPSLVTVLTDRADRVSVRAGWLARTAAAALAGGDPLGLARFRDAVFRRLTDGGVAFDLDAPGFVRFHGRTGGDRFPAARDWLLRMRDPAQKWLAKRATPRRLPAFGLDVETEATAGYLDLLFAWGVARLGEWAAGRDWEEAAASVLARPAGTAVAGVHAVLLAAFRHRIREAQTGRAERPGLPPEVRPAYAELADFPRYAVDKLRAACGILEPIDRVNPYRGRDAADLFGPDPLGAKLRRLTDPASDEDAEKAVRAALDAAVADASQGAIPRAVLAALGAAGRLPADAARDVLTRVPAAIRGLGEWAWAGRDAGGPGLDELLRRFLDVTAPRRRTRRTGRAAGTRPRPHRPIRAASRHPPGRGRSRRW